MADWAGFTQRDGVQVIDGEDFGRLDAAVGFTLTGSESDLDSALAAASFTEPFSQGTANVQESLFDEEIDGLTSIESAADEWRNSDGETIYRHVVRGTSGDLAQIRVEAFTT